MILGSKLISSGVSTPPLTTVVLDTFTDLDGIWLQDHSPDIAPGYAAWEEKNPAIVDFLYINSGKVNFIPDNEVRLVSIQSGVLNSVITADLYNEFGGTIGIAFRVVDFSRYFVFAIEDGNAHVTQYLNVPPFSILHGVILGINLNTLYSVSITILNNIITCEIDGQQIVVNSSDYQFADEAGIYGFLVDLGVPTADNFRIMG